jgi:hypothetical protein
MKTECTFQEAVESFKKFLSDQGSSNDLVWISREDVQVNGRRILIRWPLAPNNSTLAEQTYERGRDKSLGLKLEVFCWSGKHPCCYVLVPRDEYDSESLMLTELGFSIPVEQNKAIRIRTRVAWGLVRKLFPNSHAFEENCLIPSRNGYQSDSRLSAD